MGNDEEKDKSDSQAARLEKFKQLRRRAAESSRANRSDLYQEYRRSQSDPNQQAKLTRKKEEAELEMAKLDSKERGEDFERKRAWDWTVEEAEKWDEKQKEKQERMDSSAFSDFSSAAEKAYLKEMKDFKPDIEAYQKEKLKALKKDAILVEDDEGKVVAYNKDGSLYEPDKTDTSFLTNKPRKEAVDRLVESMKTNDKRRMKRRKQDEGEHVTYINEKNKQFNMKLARHYDKYNKDIRDAFERGTGI
ncbi:hypothetical protein TRICI_006523 [Trichomonascus ciferrii]|uniref:Pre-mRNA-splicing factor SYF2 n=1 Tax=Trichomonascus ciferrii TaxID=44093 RepID=A0A6A1LJQ8_9ASCO|nr:hypothetical protein TRICI_006523 [Trichomonascus ciferrii]